MAPAKDMKPLPFDDPQDAASQDDSQPTLDIQQLLDMQKLSVGHHSLSLK